MPFGGLRLGCMRSVSAIVLALAVLAVAGPAVADTDAQEGVRIYLERCAACHGAEGRGDGEMAKLFPVPMPNFTDGEYMKTRPDEELKQIISVGGGPLGRAPFMPGFGIALSEKEIDLLVGHLRSLAK